MSHNLKHNGAPYTDQAALVHADPKVTAGAGRALCTCGILSEELPTGGARRAWHKAHKLAALDAEVAEEKAETEALFGQDVLAGTPADEVQEALAELVHTEEPARKAKAPRATRQTARAELLADRKAAKAAKAAEEAAEPNAGHAELPFTKAITPGFWRSLGRDAATHVVDELHPTVKVEADNAKHVLHFTGPQADVDAAVEQVQNLWHEAILATKAWKQTDAGFLGRSTEPLERRREGYHLTEEFYRTVFARGYVTDQQGH